METLQNKEQLEWISRRKFITWTIWWALWLTLLWRLAYSWETPWIQINHHKIPKENIGKNIPSKFSIALISDTHLVPQNFEIIKATLAKLKTLNPTFIVIAWDISDKNLPFDPESLRILDSLNITTYVTLWNHDYQKDATPTQSIVDYLKSRKNFILLRNQSVTHQEWWVSINITWLWSRIRRDFWFQKQGIKLNPKTLNILVSHEPRWITQFPGFDLWLCWHTHWANKYILNFINFKERNSEIIPFSKEDKLLNTWLTYFNWAHIITSNWIWKWIGELELSDISNMNIRSSNPAIDIITIT